MDPDPWDTESLVDAETRWLDWWMDEWFEHGRDLPPPPRIQIDTIIPDPHLL